MHGTDLKSVERYDHQGHVAVLWRSDGVTVSIPDGRSDGTLGTAIRCNLPQGCLVAQRPARYWFLGPVPIPGIAAVLLLAHGTWLLRRPQPDGGGGPLGEAGLLAIAAYGFAALWSCVAVALWVRRNGISDRPVDWTKEPLTLQMHRDAGAASPWTGHEIAFRLGARGARSARRVRACWSWAVAAGLAGAATGGVLLWLGQTLAGNVTLAIGLALSLGAFIGRGSDAASVVVEGMTVRWSNGKWSASMPAGTPVGVREAEAPSTGLIVSVPGGECDLRTSWFDLDPPCPPPAVSGTLGAGSGSHSGPG